jgi:flagellar biosynthetic protein FliQ
MDSDFAVYIGRRTLEVALMMSAPVLVVTLVVGMLTAMLQAVTSLRDMTLGLVIKIGCVGVALLLSGNWMIQTALDFTNEVFNHMQTLGH